MQRVVQKLQSRKTLYQQIAEVTTDREAASIAAAYVDELEAQLKQLDLILNNRPVLVTEAA